RGGCAERRLLQSQAGIGMGAESPLQATRPHDDRSRFARGRTQKPPMSFWEDKRILVTGGRGFLGRHVLAKLKEKRPEAVFTPGKAEYDLVHEANVIRLYEDTRPDIVIHLAAVVGGIGANRTNPGKFFYDNLIMGVQLMEFARRYSVQKFVAVGT